jgi:hypothetical protein
MKVAVIGTGSVGRTLATAIAGRDHDVVVGTRDPAATAARSEWAGSSLALAAYADAAYGADLVINATNGEASIAALGSIPAETLAGRVLLDVSNALDFSAGFPPRLFIDQDQSLAEQIQEAVPGARVVKSLCTTNASVMVDPAQLAAESTMFVAGDDSDARAVVRDLLTELGWTDIIEFDSLAAARGMEWLLPMWLTLMQRLGTPVFNYKVVRPAEA